MPGGLHPPVSQWLEWPAPNYVDPVTQPKYVLLFACIIGPISIAMLCARLWVRIRVQRNPGWDDWLILISFFPVTAMTIMLPLSRLFLFFLQVTGPNDSTNLNYY